ncbi:Trafficking protein particle complex subunit [Entamoeba marina]
MSKHQIYTILIINKAGAFRWTRDYSGSCSSRSNNENIYLASSFHESSIYASQINPTLKESSGITRIQSTNFVLQCLHTETGVSFFVTASPTSSASLGNFLKEFYKIYADYVMKNPFQLLEMLIKNKKFEEKVKDLVSSFEKGNV